MRKCILTQWETFLHDEKLYFWKKGVLFSERMCPEWEKYCHFCNDFLQPLWSTRHLFSDAAKPFCCVRKSQSQNVPNSWHLLSDAIHIVCLIKSNFNYPGWIRPREVEVWLVMVVNWGGGSILTQCTFTDNAHLTDNVYTCIHEVDVVTGGVCSEMDVIPGCVLGENWPLVDHHLLVCLKFLWLRLKKMMKNLQKSRV